MARPVSRQSRKGPGSLEVAVGISGWQLVKRYCGEIGGQGDDLDTATCPPSLRGERRDRLVRRRPCQQVIQQEGGVAAASNTCGQEGQTRSQDCEVFPCVD